MKPRDLHEFFSANGAASSQPGATPWVSAWVGYRGPTARPNRHHGRTDRSDLRPSILLRPFPRGVAPGCLGIGPLALLNWRAATRSSILRSNDASGAARWFFHRACKTTALWNADASTTSTILRPNGAFHASPGQRPGTSATTIQALKGRPNRCPNPSPASMSTSCSAPKTGNVSSPMTCNHPSMPTWPRCCRTWVAHPCSSIPWMTTSICCSISPAPLPSARPWKTSRNPRRNGSKPNARIYPPSHGKPDTVHSPSPNPTWNPFANTSPINMNTIARKRSRTNTCCSSNDTTSPTMNGLCGIDASDVDGVGIHSLITHSHVDALRPMVGSGRWERAGVVVSGRGGRAGMVVSGRGGRAGIVVSGRWGRVGIVGSGRCGWVGIAVSHRCGRAGIVVSDRRGRVGTRALPFATLVPGRCPSEIFRTKGATPSQPGATPRVSSGMKYPGPTARPNRRTTVRPGFQPSNVFDVLNPGRCPDQDVALRCLGIGVSPVQSTKGATPSQPGATPRVSAWVKYRGPTARPNRRATVRPGFQPSNGFDGHNLGRCPRLAWDGALPRKKGGTR